MKLFLASQGFTTDEIANEVSKLVGKKLEEINIAIINESATYLPSEKSKRWLIKELSNIEKYIGGNIDFVNFRAYSKQEIEKRLLSADLIYIVGGKQLVLAELFAETNTTDLIKEIANKKVIMGTSAGSIVLGKQIASNMYWKSRYNIDIKDIKHKELGLVNFNIIPHYMRKDHIKWNEEFYNEVIQDNPFTLYAITDTQAVVFNNGKISFVGGQPKIFEVK